uniref:Metalloendopeptidase n=1 Tax=Strongyloides venezuelensis TaxID=75913 RepID=A0A0K0FRV3_STRVS
MFETYLRNSNELDYNYRIKKSIIKRPKYKWKLPIQYHISKRLQVSVIKQAIKVVEEETCVTFNESTKNIRKVRGVNFKMDYYICGSLVGMRKKEKPQSILLTVDCSKNFGGVLHEIFHTLGLYHEQSRRDRKKFVKIIKRNVYPDYRFNFAKNPIHNAQNFGISYDLGSLMHYDLKALGYGEATVVPLDQNYNNTIGQHNNYTFNDIKLVNYFYCNQTCNSTTPRLECKNYGYQDPRNCSRCKCPHGFAGDTCENLKPQSNTTLCGDQTINATSNEKVLTRTGIMECTYQINTNSTKKLKITVQNMTANPAPNPEEHLYCFQKMALEIKHREDKSITGLNICGDAKVPINVTSEGNSTIILWYGKHENHSFNLTYQEIQDEKQNS